MFDILRGIVILIIFTIYFIIIKKKEYKLPVKIIIVIFTIGLVCLGELYLEQIERNITSFDSVENAVEYQYRRDKDKQPLYIKQENSTIVLFRYETIPHLYEKENGKWKLSDINSQEMKKIYSTDIDMPYNIFKIKSKSDNKVYIILVGGLIEENIKEQKISDSVESKFELIKREPAMNRNFYTTIFYTILDKDIEDYKLYVNGRTLIFEK